MLKQVVRRAPTLSENVRAFYQQHHPKTPQLGNTVQALSTEIARFSSVFLVIDALDETADDQGIRTTLLSELESLPIKLLVTSRYDTSLERKFEDAARIDIEATADDVRKYVKARIRSEPLLMRHIPGDIDLQEDIVNKVVEKCRGMWVHHLSNFAL